MRQSPVLMQKMLPRNAGKGTVAQARFAHQKNSDTKYGVAVLFLLERDLNPKRAGGVKKRFGESFLSRQLRRRVPNAKHWVAEPEVCEAQGQVLLPAPTDRFR